jgi:hypothetical protein
VADFLEVALKDVIINLTEEMHTVLWWGDLRESDHLANLGVGGKITLTIIFKK